MKARWSILLLAFLGLGCAERLDQSLAAKRLPEAIPALSSLEGKHYYLLEEGYSCESNSPEHTRLLSWKDHLEVREGRLWGWGDLCQDYSLVIEASPDEITLEEGFLTFRGQKYEFHATSPQFCEKASWCPKEN